MINDIVDAAFVGVVVLAFVAFGWVVVTDIAEMRRRKNDLDN